MQDLSKESLDGNEALPQYYGKDRLVLLPKDPNWIFAYWELNPGTRRQIENRVQKPWNLLDLNLRVHRLQMLEEKEEDFFDIRIVPSADNWYINTNGPDRKYFVELGVFLEGGHFLSILQSNTVTTPRDDISDIIDENWKLTDWQMRRFYRRISLHSLSSPERLLKERKYQVETKIK